jgi:hypothetical protein
MADTVSRPAIRVSDISDGDIAHAGQARSRAISPVGRVRPVRSSRFQRCGSSRQTGDAAGSIDDRYGLCSPASPRPVQFVRCNSCVLAPVQSPSVGPDGRLVASLKEDEARPSGVMGSVVAIKERLPLRRGQPISKRPADGCARVGYALSSVGHRVLRVFLESLRMHYGTADRELSTRELRIPEIE